MPKYKYTASDKNGQTYINVIEARSRLECIKILKRNELLPVEIVLDNTKEKKVQLLKPIESEEKSSVGKREIDLAGISSLLSPVKHRDIVIFMQSFLLLKKANFNNIDAINTIRKSTENSNLGSLLEKVQVGLEQGYYMYEMLEQFPKEFPYIITNMIKVGELSGSLVESISQAIEYIEKEIGRASCRERV